MGSPYRRLPFGNRRTARRRRITYRITGRSWRRRCRRIARPILAARLRDAGGVFRRHAVDPHTGQAPKRRNDRLEQRTQEFIGRTEHADAPACEHPIDRQHGQQRSLAPSPAAHKDDAAVSGDERQRFDLARMRRDVWQGDSAARQLRFAGLKVRERRAIRQPSQEQGAGPDSLARLHPRPGYEGRPAFV